MRDVLLLTIALGIVRMFGFVVAFAGTIVVMGGIEGVGIGVVMLVALARASIRRRTRSRRRRRCTLLLPLRGLV